MTDKVNTLPYLLMMMNVVCECMALGLNLDLVHAGQMFYH